MEFLSVILAGLFGGISPMGWIVDHKVEAAFRSRVTAVETVAVRVDNTPSYRLLQGNLQRLRLAGLGVHLSPNLRLKSLAIETDPIAVDFKALQRGELDSFAKVQTVLQQPLNAALQISLDEADVNRFLASPQVKTRFSAIAQRVAEQLPTRRNQHYELLSTTVAFKDNNRLLVDLKLQVSRDQREDFREFAVHFASRLNVQQGKEVVFVDPVVTVDDTPLSPQLVTIIAQRIRSRLNLGTLDEKKIIARLLQLKIEEDEVKLAAFVQITSGARGDSGRLPRNNSFSTSPEPNTHPPKR